MKTLILFVVARFLWCQVFRLTNRWELTASRRTTLLPMASTLSLTAARALARGSSASSR